MIEYTTAFLGAHLFLAVLLFFLVNWIGEHAVDFGYTSTTLFEEPNESIALNFFLRAMSPAVFIIGLSAIAVALEYPTYRSGIYLVAIYYYAVRALIIFMLNRQRLISWPRFIGHSMVGIAAALVAYRYLIVPNRSLMPNLEAAGNELWLAILAFLYAVANKVPLSGGPGASRRNSFIKLHYAQARQSFGEIIDPKLSDDLLRLIAYSILVYEDYARPPAIRRLEYVMFWKPRRTTGVMQVAADHALSDEESVRRGTDLLLAAWHKFATEEYPYSRVTATIGEYNPDSDYVTKVTDVMEIIAKRADPTLRPAYQGIWGE
jgi:hypothetical protein